MTRVYRAFRLLYCGLFHDFTVRRGWMRCCTCRPVRRRQKKVNP
jgi:hypothetical protein